MGIAVIAAASDAFFDFAAQIKANNPLIRQLDQGVHDWCVTHRNNAENIFFVIITTLGSPLILSVVTSIVVIVKWRRHRRGTALFLALATAGGYGINLALKRHYARARPLALLDRGISSRRGVMCAHREPAYPPGTWRCAGPKDCGCPPFSCRALAHSEEAQDRGIILPLSHDMSDDDVHRVVAALTEACAA